MCRRGKNHFDPGGSYDFMPPPQISCYYLVISQNYSHMMLIPLYIPLTPPKGGRVMYFTRSPYMTCHFPLIYIYIYIYIYRCTLSKKHIFTIIQCKDVILQISINDTYFKGLMKFSPGVHQISLKLRSFHQIKFRFF